MTTDTQHNPIEKAKSQGRIRQEVSLVVQEELAIAGITEASFAELKEHGESLADLEVIDRASLADVQAFITKCSRMKTTIKQAIEPGKKWAHQLHKSYTSNENEFISTVEAIEEPAKAKKQAYLDRIEREEAERQRLIQEMQEQRRADILATGATFTPGPPEHRYSIGGHSWTAREINEADHETWTNMLRSARMVQEELAVKKAQEELEAQQERERLAAEAEALRVQREEMERREAEMKAQEERMAKMVNEVRKGELLAACPDMLAGEAMLIVQMLDYTDEDWSATVKEISDGRRVAAETARLEQERLAAEAAREALIGERVARLKAAGWEREGDDRIKLRWWSSDSGQSYTSVPVSSVATTSEEAIEEMVQRGHFELQRRAAAREEEIRQEAIEQERRRAEEAKDTEAPHPSVVAHQETVTVERDRLLILLFNLQEVLPYARVEGNDNWNAGVERLSRDVMDLRLELKDETLGPGADEINEPW
jgi:hypothetical protein